ncbi:hypothetical protein ZEAMMB73_Zm00001d006190 [Zea mays]|uniref:Uncharacterized protein n=1 Tax=Zea mays TaxID=4577 RepID=A0A1D6ETJ3_MAIZE|nr:hypothetical protein ZEAMMB73_Zm00001d006190 [Zea mays]
MQKKEAQRLFELIKSLFNQAKREWVGFLGPIHIWQKMFSFRLRTRICRDKKGVPSMAATNWGMKWDITPPTRIRQAMEMQAEVERRKCAQLNQELHSARSSFEQAHFNLCKAPNQDNQHEASSQKIAYNKHGKSMDSYVEVLIITNFQAKALAEKNMRDMLVQREHAEKHGLDDYLYGRGVYINTFSSTGPIAFRSNEAFLFSPWSIPCALGRQLWWRISDQELHKEWGQMEELLKGINHLNDADHFALMNERV